jgi:excisionase family DNA binding protein
VRSALPTIFQDLATSRAKSRDAEPAASDGVAESGYVETPFGAPVVRDVLADPGPHERLMTVREVAARLGVCTALVYRLCQRNELLALRIGGAPRLHRETVASFVGRPSGDCPQA